MAKKICGIYKIENKINGKKYIGQSVNIKERWYEHKYDLRHNIHDNYYLQNAWNKYGEENFVFNIVVECEPCVNLDNLEKYYIDYYKANNKKFGYNLTAGGEGGVPTEEAVYNMTTAVRERASKDGKSVYCPELDRTFRCAGDVQDELGISRHTITACCRKEKNRRSAGKHPDTGERLHWFYTSDMSGIDDFLKGNFTVANSMKWKKVMCIELNEVFNSIRFASDITGICASNITMCCNGTIQSAGKHPVTGEKLHWIYYNNTNNSSVA